MDHEAMKVKKKNKMKIDYLVYLSCVRLLKA